MPQAITLSKTLASLILATLFAAGCESTQETPPPPPAAPMDASALEQLRAHFQSEGANVVVASVDRVLASDDFLSLTHDTSVADFVVGTPVSIIDVNRTTLAQGTVHSIVGTEVQIEFKTTGARRPSAGDAAVAFPVKK